MSNYGINTYSNASIKVIYSNYSWINSNFYAKACNPVHLMFLNELIQFLKNQFTIHVFSELIQTLQQLWLWRAHNKTVSVIGKKVKVRGPHAPSSFFLRRDEGRANRSFLPSFNRPPDCILTLCLTDLHSPTHSRRRRQIILSVSLQTESGPALSVLLVWTADLRCMHCHFNHMTLHAPKIE